MADPNAGWVGRTARAQKFYWNADDSPNFGRPRGFDIALDSPSSSSDEPNSSSWITSNPIISVMLLFVAIKSL